jgi:hypothetical protein
MLFSHAANPLVAFNAHRSVFPTVFECKLAL